MPVKKGLAAILGLIATGYLLTAPNYTPTALSAPPFMTHFPAFIAHKSITSDASITTSADAIEQILVNGRLRI